MTPTDSLLATLRATYPTLTFSTVRKADTAHADDDRYADLLVAANVRDVLITEPCESTCSRFVVDPEEAYGIPAPAADAIMQHNAALMAPAPATTA